MSWWYMLVSDWNDDFPLPNKTHLCKSNADEQVSQLILCFICEEQEFNTILKAVVVKTAND